MKSAKKAIRIAPPTGLAVYGSISVLQCENGVGVTRVARMGDANGGSDGWRCED